MNDMWHSTKDALPTLEGRVQIHTATSAGYADG